MRLFCGSKKSSITERTDDQTEYFIEKSPPGSSLQPVLDDHFRTII